MRTRSGLETTFEYKKDIAIIHLGLNLDERIAKTKEYIEKEGNKNKGLVLDYSNVSCASSRDGGLVIIAADCFNKGVYLCNAGKNIEGLELLGILSLPGVYAGVSIDEAVDKISQA